MGAPVEILNNYLSDPHNGGQCAVLFACEGKKYIHKPRSAAADIAWAAFLDDLAPLLSVPLPRAVRPVSPADAPYTIVPFAAAREADSEQSAHLYYTRCGALLALCMLLGSVDLHTENLVADGDSPLLVDLETLLAGVTPDRADRGGTLYDALIFSHLLPNWMLQNGENVDVSALTGRGGNQLRLHGEPCPAWAYAEAICDGFRSACAGILSHREQIDRALERFAAAPFRKLLRPTDLYARLCDQLARIDAENERRVSAERLRRAYTRSSPAWAEKMSRACDSEIEAVLRGDIPYFFSYANERSLRDMHGIVAEDYFVLSPLEAARMRLHALTPEDCEAQERIIRQSLRTVCPTPEAVPLPTPQTLFHTLEERVIHGSPCAWLGLTTGARGEAYFQSIGFDLYEGLLGVLAFYAALYEATNDAAVYAAIHRHYALYRQRYIEPTRPLHPYAANICLTGGLGGHIHLLGYLARALHEDDFLQDAAKLFARFDFSSLPDPADWDVYSGVSGLLTALPLLRGRGEDARLKELAAALAESVRSTQVALTGYGHGAAGLALALGAAQYVSGEDYTADILRLLNAENAHFDAAADNWPDLRDPQRHGFMKGLCSGAPGIGIARSQLMQYVQDERILSICAQDIARVKTFLQRLNAPLRRDTLCCGNAAVVEAERILCGRVSQGRMNPVPTLYHVLGTDDYPVGLLQGWAGVGYAQARQHPQAKSSLFVWEVEG